MSPEVINTASTSDFITVGLTGGTVMYLLKEVFSFIKGFFKPAQKAEIVNDPLNVSVRKDGPYVTVGECKQHRCAIEQRISEERELFGKVINKLDENDKRSEDRSTDLHRRLDPFIETVARNSEALELLKYNLKGKAK